MNLNKKVQYGIMLALYLSRAGRARISDVAINLSLSKNFMEQVAMKMRQSGVIKSIKGPGGGYELKVDATMYDVISSLTNIQFLTKKEVMTYSFLEPENRALVNYAANMLFSLKPILSRKVVNVMQEIAMNDAAQLNRLNTAGLEN
jgi:Rrf2 family iron-sulfur cluster assembly transcriptional regulator